jgi:hypothetical protein
MLIVLKITKACLARGEYHGAGAVWAAVKRGKVVALRYWDGADWESPEDPAFAAWERKCRAELAALGEVKTGECSAKEFCYDPETSQYWEEHKP